MKQVKNIYTGQNFAMKILDKQQIIEHRMVDQLRLEVFFSPTLSLLSSHRFQS